MVTWTLLNVTLYVHCLSYWFIARLFWLPCPQHLQQHTASLSKRCGVCSRNREDLNFQRLSLMLSFWTLLNTWWYVWTGVTLRPAVSTRSLQIFAISYPTAYLRPQHLCDTHNLQFPRPSTEILYTSRPKCSDLGLRLGGISTAT
jgi:hypothetical protein